MKSKTYTQNKQPSDKTQSSKFCQLDVLRIRFQNQKKKRKPFFDHSTTLICFYINRLFELPSFHPSFLQHTAKRLDPSVLMCLFFLTISILGYFYWQICAVKLGLHCTWVSWKCAVNPAEKVLTAYGRKAGSTIRKLVQVLGDPDVDLTQMADEIEGKFSPPRD